MLPKALTGNQAEYRPDTAKFLAECSEISYSPERLATRDFLDLGADGVQFITVDSHQAFVVEFGAVTVVVVRGTEKNYGDILTDLKFRLVPWSEDPDQGSCHRGFLEGANDLYPRLAKTLSYADTLFFCGHSLGGDIAILLATAFADTLAEKQTVYSFGAARPGDAKFADYADKSLIHYRLANGCDIVPNLPFVTLKYRHTGILIYLARSGEEMRSPSVITQVVDMIVDFAFGLSEGFKFFVPVRPFRRHKIANYIFGLTLGAIRKGGG